MNNLKWKKFTLKKEQVKPVEVISISLMASVGIADGKMLPVVFLDCTNRPDIEDLLINHSKLQNNHGKVDSVFGIKSLFNNKFLYLYLSFKEPIKCDIIVKFELPKHGAGIDQLIKNQGCYIQSASSGAQLSKSLNSPKILLEISSEYIKEPWKNMYIKSITRQFQKKGYSKKKSKEMAILSIAELRKLDVRMNH